MWINGCGPGRAGRDRCTLTVISVALAAPAALAGSPAPFTEEAVERGVDYLVGIPGVWMNGVAFVDLDNDGDPDLVVTGRGDGVVGVYENDGTGHFIDRSSGNGIPVLGASAGVVAGDYDADGDLDLYFSVNYMANVLVRNEGEFKFTDVTFRAGVGDTGFGTGCAWADYDNDGWLDLYLANHTSQSVPDNPNRLYRNLGDGTFIDVASSLGVDDDNITWQAVFFDFDRDGDADLYLSNDKGVNSNCAEHNYLFENVGGAFVDITYESGTEACLDSMGVAVGDFDGNGFQDMYATNTQTGNVLLLSRGDGTFTDATLEAAVGSYEIGWGAHFFDYDNDGHQELYVCNLMAPNRLYDCDGTFPCVDMAPALGVAGQSNSFCMAVADIDDDGDLDLVVEDHDQKIRLYVNQEGQRRRWVKLRIVGNDQNRFAIGANVQVTVRGVFRKDALPSGGEGHGGLRDAPGVAGEEQLLAGHVLLREVAAGSNFMSQNELTLHYGLGKAMKISEVAVVWPNGERRTVANLPTNRTWTIYPHGRLGDGDQDGDVDGDDLRSFLRCFGGGVQPGCEMMDIDGDGDVDAADLSLLLHRYAGRRSDEGTK